METDSPVTNNVCKIATHKFLITPEFKQNIDELSYKSRDEFVKMLYEISLFKDKNTRDYLMLWYASQLFIGVCNTNKNIDEHDIVNAIYWLSKQDYPSNRGGVN